MARLHTVVALAALQATVLLAFAGVSNAQPPPAATERLPANPFGPGALDQPTAPTVPPPLRAPSGFGEGEPFPIPTDPSEGTPQNGGTTGDGTDDLTPSLSRPQVPAQQALQQQTNPLGQGQFNIRLARAPVMLGDFLGRAGSPVVVGSVNGQAVHQTIISGSVFANDNLSRITTDAGTQRTVFVGGPAGLTPGSFFLPSIAPPLGDVVTGLTENGTTTGQLFTAVLTTGTTDVFDNPADATESISDAPIYTIFEVNTLLLPASNPGDIAGRVRMQDNNSAMPQDRVYFDYNYFHNARLSSNGFGVHRFVPGIEKTFWDGMGSLEVRMPIASTLNSSSIAGAAPDTSNMEFGNLTLIPKLMLWESEEEAVAFGLGISLPTSGDIDVFFAGGGQLLNIRSESVHLIPFLAYLYTPKRSPYFVHAFLTADFDTNGNPVQADVTGNGLEHIGRLSDQTLLTASASLGQYIYRNDCRCSRVKSIAWTTELHYTAAVGNSEFLDAGAFQVGSRDNDFSLLNGTIGAHVQLPKSTVTAGYTTPLTSSDRVFDGEFRVFINRPF